MSLRTLNKKLPRDLETIALKCLAKEPEKRYASAAELADDLRRFLDGEPIKARRLSVRQRLFRWCRKRPGAAFARGVLILLLAFVASIGFVEKIAGLVILGWALSSILFFTAIIRTRLRRFLISLAITLVLAIVSGICLARQGSWFQVPSTENWYTLKILFPGFNAENLAILVCLLPLLIGLLGGLISNVRWRILSYCLMPLFLIASLQWTEVSNFVLAGLVAPIYFGLLCRLVRWHCDGNIMDTVVGALWGTLAGSLMGAMIWGLALVAMVRPSGARAMENNSWTTLGVMMVVLYGIGAVGGSILGAYLGAIVGKKASRPGHG